MRTIIFFFMLIGSLHAVALNKALTYEEALEMAKEQNKRVMVLMVQDNCRYCKAMKANTFSDTEVIERINKHYIFVELHRYNDSYPKQKFAVYGVPTTFFVYNDGTLIMKGAGGYWNKEDFFSFMDDADFKVNKKIRDNSDGEG